MTFLIRTSSLPLMAAALLLSLACTPPNDGGGGSGTATATDAASSPTRDDEREKDGDEGGEGEEDGERPESDEDQYGEDATAGGRSTVVRVENRKDGRIRVRTNLQFNRIEGDRVVPENVADAYSNCTDCQSFAVAVQINVYERGASVVAPRNTASAVNDNCLRCVTIARAYQYVIPVDDVDAIPNEVDRLVRAINKEAHYFEKIKDMEDVDPAAIQSRLNAVLAQFAELDAYLEVAMAEQTEAGESRSGPTPSQTASPTTVPATGTATASPSASATETPPPMAGTETPSPTAENEATPSQTATGSP